MPQLYHYVVSGEVYPGVMDANIKFRMYPRVYDWGAIIVWGIVGLIVGALREAA